ncbi:hypothetical protein LB507_010282 [Fusarium sp. FIESC RH6]|nr:hypothetical protein LB507_010282 [Fusarium sp. FIESC RH6]
MFLPIHKCRCARPAALLCGVVGAVGLLEAVEHELDELTDWCHDSNYEADVEFDVGPDDGRMRVGICGTVSK